MFIQSGPLGAIGLVSDPADHALPIGAWSYAANVRFGDGYIERIFEPKVVGAAVDPAHPPVWLDQWFDAIGPQAMYASDTKLFKFNTVSELWEDYSKAGGVYVGGGVWQSFQWGTSIVANNGQNPPQILYPGATEFVDLPGWGIISTDPNNPQLDRDTLALCEVIRPFRNFLVAINITEGDTTEKFPNRVWWSGPQLSLPDVTNSPSWDYPDFGSLSGIRTIGADDGSLIAQLSLGAANVIYTQTSGYLMQFTGDEVEIFSINRAIDYGVTGPHAVGKYGNKHVCVASDTVYRHDGSNVDPLVDGRVGRSLYGQNPELETFQVAHNQIDREMHILFATSQTDENGQHIKKILSYNYKDDTFTALDAFSGGKGTIESPEDRRWYAALSYGTDSADAIVWNDWNATTWAELDSVRWSDTFGYSGKRGMYAINLEGLQQLEQSPTLNPLKHYAVRRTHLDLSNLDPSITANRWKQIRQIYPHIDVDAAGNGTTEISIGWSETLVGTVQNKQTVTFDPASSIKADFRSTGRYLYLEFSVVSGGNWRLSSADYDVEMLYGR